MVDFSNIKKLDVTDATEAEYTFDLIEGEPSVFCAPATDSNKHFLDERLRLSLERADRAPRPQRGKKVKITAEQLARDLEEDRETDRILLSRCCVKRWGTAPVDAEGKAPEFSEEACLDFFRALPAFMFDPFRNWAGNIYNFVDRPKVSGDEARELGNG